LIGGGGVLAHGGDVAGRGDQHAYLHQDRGAETLALRPGRKRRFTSPEMSQTAGQNSSSRSTDHRHNSR
jgi:hypothetical protein